MGGFLFPIDTGSRLPRGRPRLRDSTETLAQVSTRGHTMTLVDQRPVAFSCLHPDVFPGVLEPGVGGKRLLGPWEGVLLEPAEPWDMDVRGPECSGITEYGQAGVGSGKVL